MRPVAAVSEPGTPLVQLEPLLLCQVQAGLPLVSFTNPLAAGSGLVERTPKKVRFSL